MASGWTPIDFDGVLFSGSVTANTTPGTYIWHARVFAPGTSNLVAGVSSVVFEITGP